MSKIEKQRETTSKKQNTFIGDCVNVWSIVTSCIFVPMVIAQHNGTINIFSESFVKDGFCVANQDKSIYM